jgi:hypothetical protein
LRDLPSQKLVMLADRIQARARDIAAATKTTIGFRRINHNEERPRTPGCSRP